MTKWTSKTTLGDNNNSRYSLKLTSSRNFLRGVHHRGGPEAARRQGTSGRGRAGWRTEVVGLARKLLDPTLLGVDEPSVMQHKPLPMLVIRKPLIRAYDEVAKHLEVLGRDGDYLPVQAHVTPRDLQALRLLKQVKVLI